MGAHRSPSVAGLPDDTLPVEEGPRAAAGTFGSVQGVPATARMPVTRPPGPDPVVTQSYGRVGPR
jgi:hypothetical protein